ncbi:MAG: SIR2 family protein [Candidatus Hodarchaeota archaeon]
MREQQWEILKTRYCERGLVLALGAGVSVDSKIPNWGEMLRRLVGRVFEEKGSLYLEQLKKNGYSLPAIASVIENSCPENKDFCEVLREELYKDFPFFPDGINDHNGDEFIKYIIENNSTMRAVGALCTKKDRDKEIYVPNPRIHRVINFNLEAVLKAYTQHRYDTRILRTIERPSSKNVPGEINMYNMHGYLRFDRRYRGDRTKEAPDVLIFTEQEYYDFFNRLSSLFNYTFLYLLREYSCLFIGLSMNDENVRRLLHHTKSEREQSLRSEGILHPPEEKILRHFAVLPDWIEPDINHLTEASLKRLGTRVLWVSDFSEIPTRLGEIYEAGGDNWTDVY